MNENNSLIVSFFKNLLLTFGAAVIAISVVGWFSGGSTMEGSGLLSLGRLGLSYPALLQVFLFSALQAGLSILFLSNLVFKEMMLLWRIVLLFTLSFLFTILLSILFQWFPIESWEAWLSFILSVSLCFGLGILAMLLKTKLEDRKYQKLLSNYKINHKKEKGEEE